METRAEPTPTLDPATFRRILEQDFRDALDDFSGAVPVQPDDYTTETVGTLLRHLDRCEGYLVMLERIARQIETCDAMRGMQNDIGPASWEAAADAAQAVLAQPTLRERLGRAPLGAEVLS